MKTRIIVGLALSALLAALIAFGGYVSFAVFTCGAVLCVYEMQEALKKRGVSPYPWGAYACAVFLYAAFLLYGAAGMTIWYALCMMFTASMRLWRPARTMEDTVCSLFMCIYPLLFYAILICVVACADRTVGRTAMLLCFAGPLAGDTLAYFIGSRFGKRKLCPAISPHKTVIGSIAGLAGGALGGLVTWAASFLWSDGASLWPLLALGLACGLLGQAGDLFASMIKRWAGIKDYGSLFPGHGGVIDRLDSVFFCAPVGLLYLLMVV